jgi:hypothetical protein
MAIPTTTGSPSAGYKFNNMQEIKSHSSVLFNERLAVLYFKRDLIGVEVNKSLSVVNILELRAINKQIYKNIRMLIRNNPVMRATLNLDTKDQGIYITDMMMGIIDRMIDWCESDDYTPKALYIIAQELNNFEMLLNDIMQYYHYFIRPDFKQKPDVDIATERYKDIADKRTVDELKAIVGKNHRVDFENLGISRIKAPDTMDNRDDEEEVEEEIQFDPSVDGEEDVN